MQSSSWRFLIKSFTFTALFFNLIYLDQPVFAFPIYAQQAYSNPREANGRIACANCHLAQKPVEIESPQSVFPNSVFEAVVKIPYDLNNKQILASGTKGGLNVGAVVILPEGFKLAPSKQVPAEVKAKNKGVYISPYSSSCENILVVGPVGGDNHQEIIFPILSPDPATNSKIHFIKYPIYVGANRGRGQVNPTGDKTNNNIINSPSKGKITSILTKETGGYTISIKSNSEDNISVEIPKGLELGVKLGDEVEIDSALSLNPNVGGFGQTETEIVLQSPERIYGYILLCFFIALTQILLVIKKKQFERVQKAEMNF